MTKKHYVEITKQIKAVVDATTDPKGREAIVFLVGRLGNSFSQENPRFRYNTFFKACGLGE